MAGKKQSTAKGSASKAKSGAKSSAAKNTRSSGSKSNTKSRAASAKGKSTSSKQSAPSVEQLRQRNQTEAILWFGAAILTACFVLIPGGSVWLMVHNVLRGVFGGWAILLAVLMGYIAVSKTMEQTTMLRGGRLALMVVIVVLFCTAGHVFGSFFPEEKSFFKLVGILYMHGVEQGGAGLVGGLVGELLVKCAEVLGARIITGVLLFVSVLIFTGTSLASFFRKLQSRRSSFATSRGSARKSAASWKRSAAMRRNRRLKRFCRSTRCALSRRMVKWNRKTKERRRACTWSSFSVCAARSRITTP